MNTILPTIIWVAVVGIAFVVAWRAGYVNRLRDYILETREELRKCTWPTWDELKGSTLLVTVAIFFLGLFTFIVDQVLTHLVLAIT